MTKHRHDSVVIVGSGPSIEALTPDDVLTAASATGATLLAVNGAIDWLGRADYFFTLDGSEANQHRMRHPVPDCIYYAATPKPLPDHVSRLVRICGGKEAGQPEPECDTNSPEWWMWRWSAKPGLHGDPFIPCVHSGNSMYGALGLAFMGIDRVLRPLRIVLLGLDGTDERRVGGGVPYNLSHLPLLFESAVPQLEDAGIAVINGSPNSRVTCFPRMGAAEALATL